MATQDHAGTAMIALVPPYETSEDLLELAGRDTADLDDQHITVIYLPSTEGFTAEDLVAAVQNFADMGDSISGAPNGWGRFDTEDGSCQIALWDLVGWSSFREHLASVLNSRGIVWDENHGSIPHQTMGYDEHGVMTSPPSFPKVDPVNFGDIHVWYDNDHVAAIELASPSLDDVVSTLLRTADDVWDHEDEAKHPRGNPGNPGQFRKKDGPADAPKAKDEKVKDEAQPKPQDDPKGPDAPPAPKGEPKGPKEPPKATGDRKPFAPEKPLTEEEAAKRGDVYGKYLPAGEYPEGDPRNDPEFAEQHAEAKRLTEKFLNASKEEIESGIGGDTETLYNKIKDPVTGEENSYRPDRKKEHIAVRDRVMAEARSKNVPKDGRMIIMAGPSGAGKSSFLNEYGKDRLGIEGDEPADNPENFVVINPDNFKDDVEVDPSRYPGLNENELAAIKHEESSAIAKLVAKSVIAAGYNVIIDITLGSAASAEKKYLDIPGADQYTDVQVALVDGDMARSRHNAGNRWKKPDKKGGTWQRQWNGRFIDMGLVETQKPTKEGYRSKNAEQFEDLVTRRTDRVTKSWIFEPSDKSVREGTSPRHEGLDQREARLSVRLATLLSDAVNDIMSMSQEVKTQERIATMSKKNVGHWIEQYKSGSISDDELVKGLTEDVKYNNRPECPHPKGSPEWYRWVESEIDPEGSIADLDGQIPDELILKVLEVIHERAEKRY